MTAGRIKTYPAAWARFVFWKHITKFV